MNIKLMMVILHICLAGWAWLQPLRYVAIIMCDNQGFQFLRVRNYSNACIVEGIALYSEVPHLRFCLSWLYLLGLS